ncbi:MAG: hypothetical protein CMF37_15005 [Leeuwenhoekiella sp.]|nr:hypothetical protein [Leeuwenhoekiella sp.]MBQ50077.1 hypothetical protein [Leeuwenhoekiella sp.]MBQ50274.1 hypothetical protein [Leeuwenhoekiella sp.]MBQ50471.1 hypothetical protein [Leeuwenhoekiella sp.]|tara:strand:+ start:3963 stop:4796 length:834 start_codon:yes stop_codon:yes gene_type:complete
MTNVTRTIYASALQSAQVLGIPYDIVDNTTLNEKFGILDGIHPTEGYPVMQYLAIGRGGHRNASGADGASLTRLNTHRASDAALFKHLPFVLREVDNDLTATQRARYGMRREETIDGVNYIAYYLLRIDNTNVDIDYNRVTVTDGDQSTVPYTPSSSDLSPTPTEVSPTGINVSDGEYLTASAGITLNFTSDIINEIVNAAKIIYGEEEYATLSEIGLVSGQDYTHSATNSEGGSFTYAEVIAAQVNTHITMHQQLWLLNNSLTLEFNLGGTESLSI